MQESVTTAVEHMKTAAQVVVAETLKKAIEESCERIGISILEDIRVAVNAVMEKNLALIVGRGPKGHILQGKRLHPTGLKTAQNHSSRRIHAAQCQAIPS